MLHLCFVASLVHFLLDLKLFQLYGLISLSGFYSRDCFTKMLDFVLEVQLLLL